RGARACVCLMRSKGGLQPHSGRAGSTERGGAAIFSDDALQVDAGVLVGVRARALALRVRLRGLERVLHALRAGVVPQLAVFRVELQDGNLGVLLALRAPHFPGLLPQPVEELAAADDAAPAGNGRAPLRRQTPQRD